MESATPVERAGTPDGSGTTRLRRRRWPWLVGLLAVAVLATSFLPWEWSFIDDGGMLTNLHSLQARHGWFLGALDMIGYWCREDQTWGLFRPAFWVFTGTFYLLPVGPAHAVRIAMAVCAVAGPLVVLGRRFTGRPRIAMVVWAAAVLGAGAELFAGIWYPSLQESSGLCFVGLGLAATRRHWVRVLCWLVAAWFKAPFAWLLLAYGLVLCLRGETRRLGALTGLVSVGTLAAAALMARGGSYTSKLDFTGPHVHANVNGGITMLAAPVLVVVAGLVLLRPRLDIGVTGGKDPTAVVLFLGGLGYLANLLAWNASSYYAAPYVYLLTLGVVFAVVEVGTTDPRWLAAALAVPVLLSAYFLVGTARAGYGTMATVSGLRDCMLRLPPGSVAGTNRREAWVRLDYIVREHRPDWSGEVVLVDPGRVTGIDERGRTRGLRYFIEAPGYGSAAPSLTSGPVVCRTPDATVYKVVPPTRARS